MSIIIQLGEFEIADAIQNGEIDLSKIVSAGMQIADTDYDCVVMLEELMAQLAAYATAISGIALATFLATVAKATSDAAETYAAGMTRATTVRTEGN